MQFETPTQIGFTIYSKSNCSFCTKVKQLLTDNQIFFLEILTDEYLFPMVFNNGEFIGGFTDTESFVNKQLCFDNVDF